MPIVYCVCDELVDIKKIKPNPRNPNTHPKDQIKLLAKIIDTQGWRAPITVSNRSGYVVRGHGRLLAAHKLGLSEVPVDFQDYDSEEAEIADMIADNRIAELAEIYVPTIKDLLEELDTGGFDMDLTGYDNKALEALITQIHPDKIVDDNFDVDAAVKNIDEPVSQYGDVWLLGRHRLMCGDSTKQTDVETLMAGKKADFVFTDPPWNVNYGAVKEGNAMGYVPRKILNDFMGTEEFKKFMLSSFASMNYASKPGCMTYVVMSAQEWGNMMLSLAATEYHWSSTIIWNKDHAVLSRKDYHTKYEPIWYGWKDGSPRLCPLDDRKQNDVWDYDRPTKSELHPTMKPIPLVAQAIINSSHAKDICLDLFGGSGTTMIAAEEADRICYMMELDPIYCDVIVHRWEETTGKKAVKDATPCQSQKDD